LIELAWNERQHGIRISWALTEAPDVEKELASEAAFRKVGKAGSKESTYTAPLAH